MAVSVTLPAGTSDAPHSIFVVGSLGSVASASVDLSFPPLFQSMQMRDVNGNGKVDQVTVVFDDTLAPYSAGVGPWTLANVPSGGTLSAVSVSGNTATLTISRGRRRGQHRGGHVHRCTGRELRWHPRRQQPPLQLHRSGADRPRRSRGPRADHEGRERQRQGRPGDDVLQRGAGRVHRAHLGVDARQRAECVARSRPSPWPRRTSRSRSPRAPARSTRPSARSPSPSPPPQPASATRPATCRASRLRRPTGRSRSCSRRTCSTTTSTARSTECS